MGGINNPNTIVNNFVATTAPTSANDSSQGYSAGSYWLDTNANIWWHCASAAVGAAVWIATQPMDAPRFKAGRFYPNYGGATSLSTAVATLDTVVYLVPYYLRQTITVTSLNIRVVNGAAGSAVKFATWANNDATGWPTGTPITGVSSNTGFATTSNNTTVSLSSLSKVLNPGIYWWGTAFTTLGPQCLSITGIDVMAIAGRASIGANAGLSGFTAPYTYATDITALDLTAVTPTDGISALGIPITYIGI